MKRDIIPLLRSTVSRAKRRVSPGRPKQSTRLVEGGVLLSGDIVKITKSLKKRFWEKVDKRGPDECWEWLGSKAGNGYGTFSAGSREDIYYAHRLSWGIQNDHDPENSHICHTCDNPPCVNPRHLWRGTQSDNMKDMIRKGRGGGQFSPEDVRGVKNVKAKLTPKKVREIRSRHAQGTTQLEISKEYGVSRAMIGYIVRRDMWKHV